ncbi:MAG: hypothetical protein WD876_01435, partial [Candidatus Pacearchaeota archaeon]
MPFTFWDFEKDGDLVGFYIGRYKQVGAFGKPVHSFKLDNGNIVHSWGTAHLNFKLYGIPFKSKLKIKYLGKKIEDRATYP